MTTLTFDKSLIQEVQEWAYIYFVKLVKGSPLFISKKTEIVETQREKKITLTEYQRKGINAYIANISLKGGKLHFDNFHNPTDCECQVRRGQGKSVDCYFDQIRLEIKDGWYAMRYAYGHKAYVDYCVLENYQILVEFDNESDFLDHVSPVPAIEMEGSYAQIKWAVDLRKRAYRIVHENDKFSDYYKGLDFDNPSAKYWIEKLKDKFNKKR